VTVDGQYLFGEMIGGCPISLGMRPQRAIE
jgi:hypothetical protein